MASRNAKLIRGRFALLFGFVVALAAAAAPVDAGAAEEGERILRLVDEVMRVEQRVMTQTMTLENARGQTRIRTVQTWNRDMGERMLMRFVAPADVADTALLLVEDDMWLYLPAAGRVRRIAGHAKRGNFMGSDFSYNDMEDFGSRGFHVMYDPEYVRDEALDGRATKVLELVPREDYDYTRLVMWVDAERNLPRRIEHYDGDEMVKVLETGEMGLVSGRWTATRVTMRTPGRGTTTELAIEEVSFDQEIPDDVFSVRQLERGR